jgi:hypothetical protein
LAFQPVALITSESKTEDGDLGAPSEGTSEKKRNWYPREVKKGAKNQIWAPFSVSFWCHFLIHFLPWFPHRVFFGFGGFVGALLGAFVGFGSPFGNHFALIFRSLNVAFPDMILASICDRFWDGF